MTEQSFRDSVNRDIRAHMAMAHAHNANTRRAVMCDCSCGVSFDGLLYGAYCYACGRCPTVRRLVRVPVECAANREAS